MRTRLTWFVAILALVSIGFLMACTAKYSASFDGLVVVPSQGELVMESFALDVSNGRISQINNQNGPITPGLPTAVVLDPAGAFAYVLVAANPAVTDGGVTAIATFPIASDGKLANSTTYTFNNASVTVQGKNTVESVPVVPVAMSMDSAGKLLFVADSATSDNAGNPVPGAISVFSIGSNASLTEVAGSPFVLPVNGVNLLPGLPQNPCTVQVACPSPLALAVTPTVYPPLYAYCSGFAPPTTENLYVPDSIGNILLNYSVSPSGNLTLKTTQTNVGVPTGYLPDGVTVDPCNRFVYVANGLSNAATANTVSAYTICSTFSPPNCPMTPPDFRLLPVNNGVPFPVSPGEGPGPLSMDAYGSFLYVVDAASGLVSQFRVSPTSGSLTALSPPSVGAGLGANSIAVRSDDSWVFVANKTSGTLSQYGINLASGNLAAQPAVQTNDTYPTGVAVK
jgi:6-phosphogluconolactonase (cycloisomerase 2 family)